MIAPPASAGRCPAPDSIPTKGFGSPATQEGSAIEGKDKALAAAYAAQLKKGQNLTIIDLDQESSYADYLVIVTAYNERQTRAIADAVAESMKKDHRQKLLSREGESTWILLDYGDVVVHVFHEDTRAFYDLDRIWAKAPRVQVPPPPLEVASGA